MARKKTETSTKAVRKTARTQPTTAPERPVPQTPDELHAWIKDRLDITLARSALIEGHAAPFDYIVHAFFEGKFRREGEAWAIDEHRAQAAPDCVVWANRGGGKTFLGALATFLDMVFKAEIQIRILAGSLEQSGHMYEHLRALFDKDEFAGMIDGPVTTRRIKLTNKSRAQILSASERSVRGTRVHKVRCDEVDLFEPGIWKAAQLTTRSMACQGPWGDTVRGSVEALSTMQNPYGLMWELVTGERSQVARVSRTSGPCSLTTPRRTLFRWGVVDALEHCPQQRLCESCGLFDECAGAAKRRPPAQAGHMAIDDVLAQKARVDRETWKSEMLCKRPTRSDSVYPEFDADLHVVGDADPRLSARAPIAYLAGMDFGWRAETVVLLASIDRAGTIIIEREHAARELTIHDHIAAIKRWVADGYTRLHDPGLGETHGVQWISIDPAGTATNDQTGKSNASVLKRHGFLLQVRRHAVRFGVQLVRTRLAPALGEQSCELTVKGARLVAPPRLLVHARCARLIECLQRYRFPPNDPLATEPSKADGFDHACDALRYLVAGLDLRKGFGRHEY